MAAIQQPRRQQPWRQQRPLAVSHHHTLLEIDFSRTRRYTPVQQQGGPTATVAISIRVGLFTGLWTEISHSPKSWWNINILMQIFLTQRFHTNKRKHNYPNRGNKHLSDQSPDNNEFCDGILSRVLLQVKRRCIKRVYLSLPACKGRTVVTTSVGRYHLRW